MLGASYSAMLPKVLVAVLISTAMAHDLDQAADVEHLEEVYIMSKFDMHYMDICGHSKCAGGFEVSTTKSKDRASKKTGTWRIERKKGEGTLESGDEVHIKNMFTKKPSYLDVCSKSGCGGGWAVSTTDQGKDRAGKNTGTWVIEKANGESGAIKYGDEVNVKNLYKDGSYLDVCGKSGCAGGLSVSTTDKGPNRAKKNGVSTGTWVLMSTKVKEEVVEKKVTKRVTQAPSFIKCDRQGVFDIMMCKSHMCNKCTLEYAMEQCQEIQRDFPGCRCKHWPASRASYSGGDFASKGQFGDAGDYAEDL